MVSGGAPTTLHVAAGLPSQSSAVTLQSALASYAPSSAPSFDLVKCDSAGGAFLDQKALAALAAHAKPGGAVEVREVVWRTATDAASNAAARAPGVRALRDAEGLRRAMLFAGLAPAAAAPLDVVPLSDADVSAVALVGALYPDLAAIAAATGGAAHGSGGGGSEALDALEALQAHLTPKLGVCVLQATRPAHAAGVAFAITGFLVAVTGCSGACISG